MNRWPDIRYGSNGTGRQIGALKMTFPIAHVVPLPEFPAGAVIRAASHEAHPDLAAEAPDDAFPPLADLLALDEGAFVQRFRGRAIMRAKRDGLVRNACVALGNVGTADDLPALLAALDDASPLVRGHAAWAVAQLAARHPSACAATAALALQARLAIEEDAFVREEIASALAS